MSEHTTKELEEKPGLLKRLFNKIDTAMKEKAEAQEGCCCCDSEVEGQSSDGCCESDKDRKTDTKCC